MVWPSRLTLFRLARRVLIGGAAVVAGLAVLLACVIILAQPWRAPTPSVTPFAGYERMTLDERIRLLEDTRTEVEKLAGRRKGMDRVPSDDTLIAVLLAVPPLHWTETEKRTELFRVLRPSDPRPVVAFCLKTGSFGAIERYLGCYRDERDELLVSVSPVLFAAAERYDNVFPLDFLNCFSHVARARPAEGSRVYCRFLDFVDRKPYEWQAQNLFYSIQRSGLRDEVLLARLREFKAKHPWSKRDIEDIENSGP